jgi:hypothetical protein
MKKWKFEAGKHEYITIRRRPAQRLQLHEKHALCARKARQNPHFEGGLGVLNFFGQVRADEIGVSFWP